MNIPVLDAEEVRVLGSLMEKSKATPEYYPMTLNSLVAACNQKSSRRPVVNYDEDTVAGALNTLKKRGLISTATGGSIRSIKYKHNFAIVFPVLPAEVAVMCLLMLRGPLTPGEINSNSGRLHEFDAIEEVQEMLEKLSAPELPLVTQLTRRPGQKEARYAHLLSGQPVVIEDDQDFVITGSADGSLSSRVTRLEQELSELKEAFNKLMKELT